MKKEGGWASEYGGTSFKDKGGKVEFTGKEKGKGIPPNSIPSSELRKKGQVQFEGQSGSRGIPPKGEGSTKGLNSQEAGTHD